MDHHHGIAQQPLAEGSKAEESETAAKRTQAHNLMGQTRRGDSLPTFIGKHRLQAAISHLNNEINIIEDELEKLDVMGESSSVCKELISSVESVPDPLLPWIKGSADGGWDRWFGGAHHSRSHKRWI